MPREKSVVAVQMFAQPALPSPGSGSSSALKLIAAVVVSVVVLLAIVIVYDDTNPAKSQQWHPGEDLNDLEAFLKSCGDGCEEEIKAGGEDVEIFVGVNQSIYRFGDVIVGTGLRWKVRAANLFLHPPNSSPDYFSA